MLDGLYKAHFRTRLGEGEALISLHGGILEGGDIIMYYVGKYSVEGDRFVANLKTARHASVPGKSNVFGRDSVRVDLSGSISGDAIEARGQSPDAPGVSFSAHLKRLPQP